jgi:hypothetical protein
VGGQPTEPVSKLLSKAGILPPWYKTVLKTDSDAADADDHVDVEAGEPAVKAE